MLPIPNPIAFEIFGIEIRYYAIMITIGVILAFLLAQKRLKKIDLNPDIAYDIMLCILPPAIIGARLYYVIFKWNYFSKHVFEILMTRNGGLAIHGALIGGALGLILFCKIKKISLFANKKNTTSFLTYADIIAPCLSLGQAIGRWGNYFNMEAHGVETTLPWAIPVIETGKTIYVHPTFLYESIWNIIVMILLIFYFDKKKKHDGEIICYYAILYSAGRFFIEGLRTDSLMLFGLRTAQFVSLALIITGIICLILLRKLSNPQNKKIDINKNNP